MWADFGFSENPYSQRPIAADAAGERLLVGRSAEIATLRRRMTAGGAAPTLEGPNGVGKTSLVSVAAYKLFEDFKQKQIGNCYIPAGEYFQITGTPDVASIRQSAYRHAITLVHENRDMLLARGFSVPSTGALYSWVNAPRYFSGGVSICGFGADGSTSPNETDGFSESGFAFAVQRILDEVFPRPVMGGIVCVLDNLEILEESRKAREAIEIMRDTVFNLRGFVWVICGAKGIVRSVASSPRLQGVLADPLRVEPLDLRSLDGLIEARIAEYAISSDPCAPVGEDGFRHLFRITNANLRNTFKFCGDFSEWLADSGKFRLSTEEKFQLLEAWIAEKSDEYLKDTKGVTPKSWDVFDGIVASRGYVAPGDFAEFGFESQQAMRPHIKRLEEANLVDSVIDDEDSRRKTISVTSLGWLVNYSRSGYPM